MRTLQVRDSLRALEKCTEFAVWMGGIPRPINHTWKCRLADLRMAHRRWATANGLPALGPVEDLRSWAVNLPYRAATVRDLARWICHADTVRSIHDWRIVAEAPPDPYWPPNIRPAHIAVARETWDVGAGLHVPGWPHERYSFPGLHLEADDTRSLGQRLSEGEDWLGELPGLMAMAWMAGGLWFQGEGEP